MGKDQIIFNSKLFEKSIIKSLDNDINTCFSQKSLEELAKENKFFQRKSKLLPHEFIDILMFSNLDQNQLSLQDTCNDLEQHHHKNITKVALHKRFNANSVMFLKSVLAEQLKFLPEDKGNKERWNMFNRVIIGDSCKFSIPQNLQEDYPGFNGCRPSKAIMNLQYTYDIKNGSWLSLDFTKATQNDQSYSSITYDQISHNDLHIRDLGFITLDYLQNIIEKEAVFLNRMPPNWIIYVQKNNKFSEINWKDIYKKFSKYKLKNLELNVFIGKKHKIPCRLIVSLTPQEVYQNRIRKVEKHAKSKGVNVSDAYRFKCRFNTFITNASSETLKTEDIDQLYKIRWQIELVFKIWKSLLSVHKFRPMKKHRLECQLLGKFIWILLNWKIFQSFNGFILNTNPSHCLSMWKFFKWARHNYYVLRAVIKKKISIMNWCRKLIYPLVNNICLEPKKGKDPHFKILNNVLTSLS